MAFRTLQKKFKLRVNFQNSNKSSKPSNSVETNPTEGQEKNVSKKGYDLDMSALLCDGDGVIEAPEPVSFDVMSTNNDSFDSQRLSNHDGSDNGSPLKDDSKDSMNSSDSLIESSLRKRAKKVLGLTILF